MARDNEAVKWNMNKPAFEVECQGHRQQNHNYNSCKDDDANHNCRSTTMGLGVNYNEHKRVGNVFEHTLCTVTVTTQNMHWITDSVSRSMTFIGSQTVCRDR